MHSIKPVTSFLHLRLQVINEYLHYTMPIFVKIHDSGHFQHQVIMCQTHSRLARTQM